MVRVTALLAAVASVTAVANALKLQVYSAEDYSGIRYQAFSPGNYTFVTDPKVGGWKGKSWKFYPDKGDGCCVTFCAGDVPVAASCGGIKRKPNMKKHFRHAVLQCNGSPPTC